MEQITRGGCRFDRNGACHDWVVYDDGVRLYYEALSLCSDLVSK